MADTSQDLDDIVVKPKDFFCGQLKNEHHLTIDGGSFFRDVRWLI